MCFENKDRLINHNDSKTFEINDNCYKLIKKDKQIINTIKDISIIKSNKFYFRSLRFNIC
jgi:hypothetical protein